VRAKQLFLGQEREQQDGGRDANIGSLSNVEDQLGKVCVNHTQPPLDRIDGDVAGS
jgi:hypothetical protein